MQLRWMYVCVSVCLSVNIVYMYWSDISVTDCQCCCRYFVQINVLILSSHCCLFDAVLQYPHLAGNWLSWQLLLGSAVDVGAALTTAKTPLTSHNYCPDQMNSCGCRQQGTQQLTAAKTYLRFHQRTSSTTCVIQPNGQPIKYEN